MLNDVHRGLAFDAERVEAGEQPFERQPEAGCAFGAVDCLDVAALAVADDGPAQSHDQHDGVVDTLDLVLADGARFELPSGEQSRDRLGEFFAHLLGAVADMLQRAFELAVTDRRQPRQQETVAHAADHRVVRVDHAVDANSNPTLPCQASVRPPSLPTCRVQAPS